MCDIVVGVVARIRYIVISRSSTSYVGSKKGIYIDARKIERERRKQDSLLIYIEYSKITVL